MKVRYVAVALTAALAIGAAPAAASTASPDVLNVTAVVVDQMCVGPGGDFVRVTLSGQGNSSSTPRFAWDFENNGSMARPTVNHIYLDEITVTAELFARNAEGDMDSDTVTFQTLRCES